MTRPTRPILALSILTIALAACGTTGGSPVSEQASPSQPTEPSAEPSAQPSAAPSEAPADQERDTLGTITVAQMAVTGPGASIQETLDAGEGGDLPSLVNGALFRDTDGRIYLATTVSDTAAPTFDGPMLEVLEMASDAPELDMANAEILGLEEANGIVFQAEAQVLGFLDVR